MTNTYTAETQDSQNRPISQYQSQSQSSQSQPPVPAFDAPLRARSTSIHALLNDDASQPTNSTSTTTKPPNSANNYHTSATNNNNNNSMTDKGKSAALAIDYDLVVRLHDDVSARTTGCSVEQLEQVNSVLMDTVWRTRQEWNRSLVAIRVGDTFNKVLEDMEECGWEFGPSSWGRVR